MIEGRVGLCWTKGVPSEKGSESRPLAEEKRMTLEEAPIGWGRVELGSQYKGKKRIAGHGGEEAHGEEKT